ncbi:cytochrome P450 704C1-like isoform X2 [Aristolochia californica]|uniref:cytochrome P450 704C1-like isoform X2 n=1 Tax=Aristolochia californica TaxID=171875 RepID=UPI0035D71F46
MIMSTFINIAFSDSPSMSFLMGFLYSPPSLAAVATTLVLVLLLLKVFHGRWSSRERPLHPLAGTIYHQILNRKRLHHYYTELALKHTTFRILGARGFEGWYQTKIMSGLLGDGIFAVDGEKWRHQRKLASYDFSTRALRETSSQVFRSNAAKLARIISESVSNQEAVDVQELFMKTTLDSIFKVAFGTDLDNLGGKNQEGPRFIRAFDQSNAIIFRRYGDIFWEIERALNIGPEAKIKRNIQIIDDFIYKLIHEKMKQLACQDVDSEERKDIISRFLIFSKEGPKNINARYLRDIVLNIIIAGKDTTAATLAWFLYMLCENPLVQEKIAQEVTEVIGPPPGISMAEFAELVTEESLNKMHYLHAALTETLRLHPAVAVDYKSCLSDDTLPDGFRVKKGYKVGYLPYAMGRMKFLWGEDAEKFRPERWLSDDGIFQPASPFKFASFQAGPRICLGKDFAYKQMKISAAVLLHFFTFKLANEKKRVRYKTMLTLHISNGLHLRAYNR